MRMKLIASLLVLCLTFSIGSALAQPTSSPNIFPDGVIILNGNVTGNFTVSGPGGGEQNFSGFVLITQDLNKKTEKIQIWDENARTIAFRGNGSLTPIKINRPPTAQNLATSESGLFAFGDLKDFNCNMTNLTAFNGPQTANVKLTGPEMKVFGGWNDVVNRFLSPSSTENTSECSLTELTYFVPEFP